MAEVQTTTRRIVLGKQSQGRKQKTVLIYLVVLRFEPRASLMLKTWFLHEGHLQTVGNNIKDISARVYKQDNYLESKLRLITELR